MNDASGAIARWLEQKRRTDRTTAAVLAVLALGSGSVVFLLMALLLFTLLSTVLGAFIHSVAGLGLLALGLTAGFFVRSLNASRDERQLRLDPMGYWILKDISSIGPGLVLEGLRQVRCCGQLGEFHVAACAHALAYLAAQNAAIGWQELVRHCPQQPWPRLREQLCLVDGVLFLGDEADRLTLMDPFRLRLRWMLEPDQRAGQGPEPTPKAVPVQEPEQLSAYELLGLSPSAAKAEVKKAYRKRVKECHPDLFAGMDEPAKAMAERWTRALNAAYASLNPRPEGARPSSTGER